MKRLRISALDLKNPQNLDRDNFSENNFSLGYVWEDLRKINFKSGIDCIQFYNIWYSIYIINWMQTWPWLDIPKIQLESPKNWNKLIFIVKLASKNKYATTYSKIYW